MGPAPYAVRREAAEARRAQEVTVRQVGVMTSVAARGPAGVRAVAAGMLARLPPEPPRLVMERRRALAGWPRSVGANGHKTRRQGP
jgi:hypothetical protein